MEDATFPRIEKAAGDIRPLTKFYNSQGAIGTMIEMVESYTKSPEYKEGIKKVGPGSIFYYRCIFDPVPSRELKNPEKYGAEDPKDVRVAS